ncbi:hypothetical protein BN1110_06356 [bacterium YEK0313]|nr:hypothetical protein BN1110_06356 [bacterium YEK0313]
MTEHVVGLIWDAWRAKRQGREALAACQTSRLVDMVAYARARSPFYGERYHDLPDRIEDPRQLPVTDKKLLMERFDEWCTDRAVTLQAAEALVDDPSRIGEWFLGKYTVMTTSGTTGRRGIFVVDDRTMAVVTAMMLRWVGDWLSPSDYLKIVARRGRMAMVMATGGHFASAVAAARLKKRRGKHVEVLSAHMPMTELVARLNRFQPAILAPYASMAALLADEQEAGRLDIHYRPVAPGEQSHTVLISNLANRVQPILRYDLGDSVLQRPDPCPCCNPLPAIRVQGRSADVLTFRASTGEVRLPPLALTQRIEAVRGITLFQLAQTAPAALEMHLQLAPTANAETVWREAEAGLRKVLAEHGLEHVVVERGDHPGGAVLGGKFREVIPLSTSG